MTQALLDLPAHLRQRLAQALDSGLLPLPCSATTLRSALNLREDPTDILKALSLFESLDISPRAAAHWIRSLDEATARVPRPDLVWSGPEVRGIHARDTRRVYDELISTAERSLWISTFVYYDGPKAFQTLAHRMAEQPSLKVTLLLNIQRHRNDSTSASDIVHRFAHQFWTQDWPGPSHPSVYYDPRSLDPSGPTGVLHAKATIADNQSVFITSANLTEAALDRNYELGLLLRDPTLATTITSHLRLLIDQELLHPLPTR